MDTHAQLVCWDGYLAYILFKLSSNFELLDLNLLSFWDYRHVPHLAEIFEWIKKFFIVYKLNNAEFDQLKTACRKQQCNSCTIVFIKVNALYSLCWINLCKFYISNLNHSPKLYSLRNLVFSFRSTLIF
jgi:hypothetical protein